MKVTKKQLKRIIREEIQQIKNLNEVFGQNWFQRVLRFKSTEADQVMEKAKEAMQDARDAVQRADLESLTTPGEGLDSPGGLFDFAPNGLASQVRLLRYLPDKEQRARGEKVYTDWMDTRSDVIYKTARLEAERYGEEVARRKREEREEELRRKEERAEARAAKQAKAVRKAQRSSGSGEDYSRLSRDQRRYHQSGRTAGHVSDTGDEYGSITNLEESNKSKLKRMIREELAKKIS